MKKLLTCSFIVLLVWLFVLPVKLQVGSGEQTGPTTTITTTTDVAETTVDLYEDEDAAATQVIVSHAVKFREDVVVENIRRKRRTVVNASTGSGVVLEIDRDRKVSMVLTAEHVCVNSYSAGEVVKGGTLIVISSSKYVVTVLNERLRVEKILHKDPVSDVCVVQVEGIAGTPAKLSPFYPPLDARVKTSGAPKGYWDENVVSVVDGRYTGIRKKPLRVGYFKTFIGFSQYSLPVVSGMSGSAVYYRGRIVGILTVKSTTYGYIGWGPGLSHITPVIERAREKWQERDEVEEIGD